MDDGLRAAGTGQEVLDRLLVEVIEFVPSGSSKPPKPSKSGSKSGSSPSAGSYSPGGSGSYAAAQQQDVDSSALSSAPAAMRSTSRSVSVSSLLAGADPGEAGGCQLGELPVEFLGLAEHVEDGSVVRVLGDLGRSQYGGGDLVDQGGELRQRTGPFRVGEAARGRPGIA